MQLHQIKPNTIRKSAKRVGRGGKRGKTSGRGHKGQKARAGNSGVPQMREIIKKIPKLRGHGINRAKTVNSERVLPHVVNVSVLNAAFSDGDTVTPASLLEQGAVSRQRGRIPKVKVLGTGDISKKITLSGCTYSESAKEKIEKAGGKVI